MNRADYKSICLLLLAVIFLLSNCGDENPSKPLYPLVDAHLTSPPNNSIVFDTVLISLEAIDTSGVEHIDIYIDSLPEFRIEQPPWQAHWITNNVYRDSSQHIIHAYLYNIENRRSYSDTIAIKINNDKTPPASITDLELSDSSYSSLTVSWTAQGDDSVWGYAHSIEFRQHHEPISETNWDDAILCSTQIDPIMPLSEINYTIPNLCFNHEYYLAVKTYDEMSNVSAISNCIQGHTQEIVQISDVSVLETTDSSCILTWTIPGTAQNRGHPYRYDVRFSEHPIDIDNWNSAEQYLNSFIPGYAGDVEQFEILDIETNKHYNFAVKCLDKENNEGPLSNSVFFRHSSMFEPPYTYLYAKKAYGICTADLNGDGYSDLATTNKVSPHISVIINNQDKTFTRSMNFYVGDDPTGIIAVNVDNDNDMDLVVADYGIVPYSRYDYIRVMINNGAAVFQRYSHNADDTPRDLFAADFDNDGYQDLAVTSVYKDSVLIYINKGDGFFEPFQAYPVGRFPNGVSGADFNGDGYTDLVVANWYTGGVSVLLNDGNAHFWSHRSLEAGERPLAVCTGDYDNDGDYDFAIANQYSDDITIFLNNGEATFVNSATHAVEDDPTWIINQDFNNDGILDLAVSNCEANKIYIYIGFGDGTFTLSEIVHSNGNPRTICAADFDLDGDIDIAATNYDEQGIVIHYNNIESFEPQ